MNSELLELLSPFILSGGVAGASAWVAMRVENAVIRSRLDSIAERVHRGPQNLTDAVQALTGKVATLEERTKNL